MKKPNKKEREAISAFLKEYQELSTKHALDIKGEIQVTPQGIIPVMKIVKIDKDKEAK